MDSSARSLSNTPAEPPLSWSGFRSLLAPAPRLLPAEEGRVLRVLGPLDKRVARALKAQARAFAEAEGGGWSLDLSGVASWDAEGLSALVYALDVSELAGKELVLVDPPAALRQTLELAQLHHLFTIHDRED